MEYSPGYAYGGEPGGGVGCSANEVFACGGEVSAVYRQGLGREIMAVAAGGGGGHTGVLGALSRDARRRQDLASSRVTHRRALQATPMFTRAMPSSEAKVVRLEAVGVGTTAAAAADTPLESAAVEVARAT